MRQLKYFLRSKFHIWQAIRKLVLAFMPAPLKNFLKLICKKTLLAHLNLSAFTKKWRSKNIDMLAGNPKTVQKSLNHSGSHEIRVIENARIMIRWGDGSERIVGKRSVKSTSFTVANLSQYRVPESYDKFYIVTPSFNASRYIDSTIISVVTQEGNFEINYHVQDGSSTDGTIKKLTDWSRILTAKDCPLIRCKKIKFTFESSPDKGMYDAINQGFGRISPPEDGICTWINADDVLSNGALATVQKVFKSNDDASWIMGAVNCCGVDQEELSYCEHLYPQEIIAEGLCDHINWRFIQQEGSFWTGQLWSVVDGANSNLKLCGDWDLWRRFAQNTAPIQIMWSLGKFRSHGAQLTSNINNYFHEIESILSLEVRKSKLNEILNRRLEPSKVITRQFKIGEQLRYKLTPLQKQFTKLVNHRQVASQKLIENHLQKFESPTLKVLTFCTLDVGGAGTGSTRRVEALRNIGIDARLLSLVSRRKKDYIGQIIPALDATDTSADNAAWRVIVSSLRQQITGKSYFNGQDFFSTTESVLSFQQLVPLIEEVDIIHFHWVVGMLDYEGMADALKNKPIVWTTADMNSFTGGCHYSEGCTGYIQDCSNCPQLGGENKMPHQSWKTKKRAYEDLDITLICPSEYIANLARKSSLLGDKDIVIIPNAYPVNMFKPEDKKLALKSFNIPVGKKLVLFAAESLTNIRKGSDLLHQIADLLVARGLHEDIEFLCIGEGDVKLPLKVHQTGKLKEAALPAAYSAADVYLSLSKEDVGPMTVVESLLCGTPVVGFSIGVLPEVVIQDLTGKIVKPFDIEEICDGLEQMLYRDDSASNIRQSCRQSAVRYADPVDSANRHKMLYDKLVEKYR